MNCISNSEEFKMYAERFSQGHWTFFGPGYEKKCCGHCNCKPEGKWNSIASQMVHWFNETGPQSLRVPAPEVVEFWRSLKGKETIHFNADASTKEDSVNQDMLKFVNSQEVNSL